MHVRARVASTCSAPPLGSKLQYFFRMFFSDHNCMLHNMAAGLSVPDRWFEDVKFSRGCKAAAAALTSDKVTAIAVVEVFTIWITGIIPLLFDSVLRESALTSTVM